MLITSFNPPTDELEQSFLSNPVSAGISNLTVKNNDRFAADQKILVGEMGTETAEILQVSSVSGGTTIVTTSGTVYPHGADTPVYVLRFDKTRFYRSTTGVDGTYSLLDTVDIDVDNNELKTYYDDTTGESSYYYKVSHYHSIDLVETEQSDPVKGAGYRRRQVGYIIDSILDEVSDPNNQHISRSELLGYFNDVNDDLITQTTRPYVFLHTREALARVANRNYIDFPTNDDGEQTMWKFDRMDYNYTDNDTDPVTDITYTLVVLPIEEFENRFRDNTIDTTTVSDKAQFISIDTAVNRFRYHPPSETSTGAIFYLYYWKYFDVIDSEADEIETPTAKIYKLYAKAMFYRKRGTQEASYNQVADRLMGEYTIEKAKLSGHNRKDRGTPRRFKPEGRVSKSFRF